VGHAGEHSCAIFPRVTDEKEEGLRACLRMTEAVLDAMGEAIRSASIRPENPWTHASYGIFLRKSNELVEKVRSIEQIDAPVDLFDLSSVPSSGNLVTTQQEQYFETARTNLQILRAHLENRVEPKQRQVTGIADFLQSTLRRATLKLPDREKEVQDTIEGLLIGRGMEKGVDYDREVGRVKASAKEVIPDFIFPPLETALEVKLLKDQAGIGRIIDEMNADIRAYLQDYKSAVFVVYDLGAIRDELEFRRDLETTDGVKVIVVKH
jgi:hypothetical protein